MRVPVLYIPPLPPYNDPYEHFAIQIYSPYRPPVVELERMTFGVEDNNVVKLFNQIEAVPNQSMFSAFPATSADFSSGSLPLIFSTPMLGLVITCIALLIVVFSRASALLCALKRYNTAATNRRYDKYISCPCPCTSPFVDLPSGEHFNLCRKNEEWNLYLLPEVNEFHPEYNLNKNLLYPYPCLERMAMNTEEKNNVERLFYQIEASPNHSMYPTLGTTSMNFSSNVTMPFQLMYTPMLGLLACIALFVVILGSSSALFSALKRYSAATRNRKSVSCPSSFEELRSGEHFHLHGKNEEWDLYRFPEINESHSKDKCHKDLVHRCPLEELPRQIGYNIRDKECWNLYHYQEIYSSQFETLEVSKLDEPKLNAHKDQSISAFHKSEMFDNELHKSKDGLTVIQKKIVALKEYIRDLAWSTEREEELKIRFEAANNHLVEMENEHHTIMSCYCSRGPISDALDTILEEKALEIEEQTRIYLEAKAAFANVINDKHKLARGRRELEKLILQEKVGESNMKELKAVKCQEGVSQKGDNSES